MSPPRSPCSRARLPTRYTSSLSLIRTQPKNKIPTIRLHCIACPHRTAPPRACPRCPCRVTPPLLHACACRGRAPPRCPRCARSPPPRGRARCTRARRARPHCTVLPALCGQAAHHGHLHRSSEPRLLQQAGEGVSFI
jgi:hypothetical protein